jgi:DNA-binding ferritin-like protein
MPQDTIPSRETNPESVSTTTQSTASALEDFAEVKTRAEEMITENSARNGMFDKMERAYKIQPSGSGTGQDAEGNTSAPRARKLFDSHPHNAINRIIQMYTANEPSIDIPVASADKATDEQTAQMLDQRKVAADKAQMFMKALLHASDQVSERSIVSDLLYAASIYGEVPAIIDNLMADGQSDTTELSAPFIFETMHPKNSYPRYRRRGGLYQHLFVFATKIGQVKSDYGDLAKDITGGDSDVCNIYDYMDARQHIVWLKEQASAPILQVAMPAGMSTMPRVSRIVSSNPGFFELEVDKRMPFLYSMVKSGLWAARNTMLTAMQTNTVDFLNPKILYRMLPGRESEAPDIDWAKRGDKVVMQTGESAEPFPFRSMPPELLQFNALVEMMTQQSTLNPISGGTAPGGVFSASGLNLLSTASRLATFSIARAVESALSQMLTRTLQWIRAGDYRPELWSENGALSLTPADLAPLGKNFYVRVTLKPDQQAERQMVAALSRMLREMGLGYEDFMRPLEEGQIIESVSSAIENMKTRAFVEAELPKVAAQSAKIADALLGITATVPEAPQGLPPEALSANLGAGQGVPPGMLTPDMVNPAQAQGLPPAPEAFPNIMPPPGAGQ